MKIDPNLPIGLAQELVLCEDGRVVLHDGSSTALAQLADEAASFLRFCRALDPNRNFLVALIPDDRDRPVYFRAREVAREAGLHMQAPVDTPERHHAMWKTYRSHKQTLSGSRSG